MDELHNNNKRKTRRHFDKEFKRDAVRLYYLSTASLKQVASELGISDRNLFNWVREEKKSQALSNDKTDLIAENRRLRKENEQLKMEKEILKLFFGLRVS